MKRTAAATLLMALVSVPFMAAFGSLAEMSFWERNAMMLLWIVPTYFIAQPEWERRDARRRERDRRRQQRAAQ